MNVNNLSVQLGTGAGFTPEPFQNLKVIVNGAQYRHDPRIARRGRYYTFSGTPFKVPAGGTVNVNVFADTLSTATGTTSGGATLLAGISGTGSVSYDAISLPGSSVQGQNLAFAGSASITIGSDSSQPAAGVVTMGSTGNTLSVVRLRRPPTWRT